MDDLAERASRITPQEWRVIALSIEGVGAQEACDALGIAPGTLESHKQAIRRKLGIRKGQRFEAFVRENFAEGVSLPEPAEPRVVDKPTQDRRVRWLLRITLQEVKDAATTAGLRAELLAQTAKRMGAEASAEADREVEDLKQVSEALHALFRQTIEGIRARGTDTSEIG